MTQAIYEKLQPLRPPRIAVRGGYALTDKCNEITL